VSPERLERLRGLLAPRQLCVVKFSDVLDTQAECAALRTEVERLRDPMREQTWSERFRVLTERAYAGESRLAVAIELLREDEALWQEWRSTDITEDEDGWVSFTNRAHAHHDKVRALFATRSDELVAFLAARPAAPARCTCSTDCEGICPACRPVAPEEYVAGFPAEPQMRRGAPPAAPARTEAEPTDDGCA
jgi:hypothetical protein